VSDDPDRYLVPGLARGLEILRCFDRERPALSAGELARLQDLPRSTVFRLVRTLEAMGFLVREVDGRLYRLGPAVLGLGYEYLAGQEVPDIARPALEALRDATGASAHLAIRDGAEIIYLARYASRSAIASNIRVGSRLPAHATTMGRVLLADLDDAALGALYQGVALSGHTAQTPPDLDALKAMLAADRARGHVIGRAFYERGVVSVAAPVREASGRTVAAINVTAADHAFDPAELEGPVRDRVVATAIQISTWLGYRPQSSRIAS